MVRLLFENVDKQAICLWRCAIRAVPLTTNDAQDRHRTDHLSIRLGQQTPCFRLLDDVHSFGSDADMKLGQCGRGGDSKLATVSVDRKLLVEPLEFTTDIRHLTSFDDLGA